MLHISALCQESGNNAVEAAPFVMQPGSGLFPSPGLACAQSSEVFTSLGDYVRKQLDHNPSSCLAADVDVEKAPCSQGLLLRFVLLLSLALFLVSLLTAFRLVLVVLFGRFCCVFLFPVISCCLLFAEIIWHMKT